MMDRLKPKYTVRESERKVVRTKYRVGDNGLESYEVEENEGYIVTIPGRHEFVVPTFKQLQEMGMDKAAPMFDSAGEIDEALVNMVTQRVLSNLPIQAPAAAKKG